MRRSSGDGIGDSDKVRFSYTVAVTERGEAYPKMASGSGFVNAAAILAQRDRDTVNGCQHDGCSHEIWNVPVDGKSIARSAHSGGHRERGRKRVPALAQGRSGGAAPVSILIETEIAKNEGPRSGSKARPVSEAAG